MQCLTTRNLVLLTIIVYMVVVAQTRLSGKRYMDPQYIDGNALAAPEGASGHERGFRAGKQRDEKKARQLCGKIKKYGAMGPTGRAYKQRSLDILEGEGFTMDFCGGMMG